MSNDNNAQGDVVDRLTTLAEELSKAVAELRERERKEDARERSD